MPDAGSYRNHLTGEAAYRSFVPLSLQEAVGKSEQELMAWHEREELREAVAHTRTLLVRFQDKWRSFDPEKQGILEKELLRREAEASVGMAYPRQSAVLPAAFPENGMSGELPFFPGNLMGMQRNQTADPESLLESIPEELRKMAAEDIENLCEAGLRSEAMTESLPVSGRLLKDLHYIVLYGVHYDKMYRGEFRHSPVWIGEQGQDLRSAAFVPPVEEEMMEAFSKLEFFLHYEEKVDPLIKAALIHYQFETIHPFIDGNGRMGRLLTLLYLKESFELTCPWIPLSVVLLRGIDRYYREIRTLQLYGDYSRWTLWFLRILDDAAEEALLFLS